MAPVYFLIQKKRLKIVGLARPQIGAGQLLSACAYHAAAVVLVEPMVGAEDAAAFVALSLRRKTVGGRWARWAHTMGSQHNARRARDGLPRLLHEKRAELTLNGRKSTCLHSWNWLLSPTSILGGRGRGAGRRCRKAAGRGAVGSSYPRLEL